jgi:formate dehydrogenase major subunit
MPWHFGTYKSNEQGVVGDTVNDLIMLSGDPNVSIHDSKAFVCGVRAGRRSRETTERLGGIDATAEPAGAAHEHPSEQPEHASQTGQAVFNRPPDPEPKQS